MRRPRKGTPGDLDRGDRSRACGFASRRGELEQELIEPVTFDFCLGRRGFVQLLGAGLLVTVGASEARGQWRGRGRGRGRGLGRREVKVSARLHIDGEGAVTLFTGKVEAGQGSRAELSAAAAEELRVGVDRVRVVMGDTRLVPDDGITAGSRTTPSTVPAVRRGAAAARELLTRLAARRWKLDPSRLEAREGRVRERSGARSVGYGELAASKEAKAALEAVVSEGTALTPPERWTVLGAPVRRPEGRDFVTGRHRFPSDLSRPGMLHAKVLRPPSFGARLLSVDLAPARALEGVRAFRDGELVAVAAPTSARAREALELLARGARWQEPEGERPSSRTLFEHLRRRARGGVPRSRFEAELASARVRFRRTYEVAYVQHAPLEPRVALAEWSGDSVTVWTGTQNPFGHRRELAAAAGADPLAFRLAHLEEPRLEAVLERAARRFGWAARRGKRIPNRGVGLACGTKKGSFVAACVEVAADRSAHRFRVERVLEAFECGAVLDPRNLARQVEGCVTMGLGPALREAVEFEEGRVRSDSFATYRVPRFSDLPRIEVELLDRRDLPPAGARETPIIALAPAIAGALADATGSQARSMPIGWPEKEEG